MGDDTAVPNTASACCRPQDALRERDYNRADIKKFVCFLYLRKVNIQSKLENQDPELFKKLGEKVRGMAPRGD